jgi:hypothetical protein
MYMGGETGGRDKEEEMGTRLKRRHNRYGGKETEGKRLERRERRPKIEVGKPLWKARIR